MKIINILFASSVFLIYSNSFGQDTISPSSLIIGKWKVCTDYNNSKDHKCKKRNLGYEFFKDGTLKELKSREYKGEKIYFSGNWTLSQGLLTITIDDDRLIELPRNEYTINWLGPDRFYALVQDKEAMSLDYLVHFQRRR